MLILAPEIRRVAIWNNFHASLEQMQKVYDACKALVPERFLEETTSEKKYVYLCCLL
jgi:hypothetical protein